MNFFFIRRFVYFLINDYRTSDGFGFGVGLGRGLVVVVKF